MLQKYDNKVYVVFDTEKIRKAFMYFVVALLAVLVFVPMRPVTKTVDRNLGNGQYGVIRETIKVNCLGMSFGEPEIEMLGYVNYNK